jgi:hypothetical protein
VALLLWKWTHEAGTPSAKPIAPVIEDDEPPALD